MEAGIGIWVEVGWVHEVSLKLVRNGERELRGETWLRKPMICRFPPFRLFVWWSQGTSLPGDFSLNNGGSSLKLQEKVFEGVMVRMGWVVCEGGDGG